MKIYTSYFAKMKHLPTDVVPISICAKPPAFYTGLQYKKIAPSYRCLMDYKSDHDEDAFVKKYFDDVLYKLDQKTIENEIKELSQGKDVALLCFEKSTDFCHRHVFATWMKMSGIDVTEYK